MDSNKWFCNALLSIFGFLSIRADDQFWTEKKIDGEVIKTIRSVSFIQCTLKCRNYRGCELVGYDKRVCTFYKEEGGNKNNHPFKKSEKLYSPIKNFNSRLARIQDKRDCLSYYRQGHGMESGLYLLENGHRVFCDQTLIDGGWTVFQRRQDGSVDFYRDWNVYRHGFGDLEGEFWLGNNLIHELTDPAVLSKPTTLRIVLVVNGKKYVAEYERFSLSDESSNYTLSVSGYSGNIRDAMLYHDGAPFSTNDRVNNEQPEWALGNCGNFFKAAWWYKACYMSNLNGFYRFTNQTGDIYWGTDASGKQPTYVEMKFRRGL